jgi:hypothetical protein
MPYPEYIEARRLPDGRYRFIMTKKHRGQMEYVKQIDLKLSELPDDFRSQINLLRMRPNNSYLEGLGAISGDWMCVCISKTDLNQLQVGTGHTPVGYSACWIESAINNSDPSI